MAAPAPKTKREASSSVPTCFDLSLKYPLRDNYVVSTAIYRGLFDGFEYVGGAVRREVSSSQPLKLVEYNDHPVTVYQTTGFRLNQRNGDILLALLQRALNQGFAPNERILVKMHADELLTAIGKDCRQHNRNWLSEELSNMKRSCFKVAGPKLGDWEFSLVSDLVSDAPVRGLKAPSYYEIELNARLTQVFLQCGWSIVKGPVLVHLLDKDLFTRALYLLYCTYPVLPSLHESELQKIFHRENLERKEWLAMLRKSLVTIRELTGWHQLEVLRKAMRKGAKLLPRGQVIAVEHAPEAKKLASAASAPTKVVSTATAKKSSYCVWSMTSTAEDLQVLGKQAFVASGKYGTPSVQYQLTSLEESAFAEQLAGLGRLSAKQQMESLYEFLVVSRAASGTEENDI